MGQVNKTMIDVKTQLGIDLKTSPSICNSLKSPICESTDHRYKGQQDWCHLVETVPKTLILDRTTEMKGAEFSDFHLMYLLTVTDEKAIFLAQEEDEYFPEYLIVEISKDQGTWKVLKNHTPRFINRPACKAATSSNSTAIPINCWQEYTLLKGMNGVELKTPEGVVYKTEYNCKDI
jgi:hypothetical protein